MTHREGRTERCDSARRRAMARVGVGRLLPLLFALQVGCSSDDAAPAEVAGDAALGGPDIAVDASEAADADPRDADANRCPGGWAWDGQACAPLCDPPCGAGFICGEGPACIDLGVSDGGGGPQADAGDDAALDADATVDADPADPTQPVCAAAEEDDCGRYCQAVASCMLGDRLNRELLGEGFDQAGIDPDDADPCAACVDTCRASIGDEATAEYTACALAVDGFTACEGEFVGFSTVWTRLMLDCCVDTDETLCGSLCGVVATNTTVTAVFPQCVEGP